MYDSTYKIQDHYHVSKDEEGSSSDKLQIKSYKEKRKLNYIDKYHN